MDGILSGLRIIDGELVAEGNELLTVSSRKNYVRGEVNEEDVGEVKAGMKADLQMYAYRTRQFSATVSSDPARGRSGDAALHRRARPGKSARKSDGRDDRRDEHHHRPPRKCAPRADPRACSSIRSWSSRTAWCESRTVKVGYRTLEFTEALDGLKEGAHVVVADQDKLRPGQFVRQRVVALGPAGYPTVTPPLYIALRFLGHRKRAFFLSLGGVVFGVAIFICTQAQTQGFAKNFIDSTLGSNGALVMRSRVQTLEDAAQLPPLPVQSAASPHSSKGSTTRRKSCG